MAISAPEAAHIPAVVFDIDGTLADDTDLYRTYPSRIPSWDAFFEIMDQCAPIAPTVDLLRNYHRLDYTVFICTARPERFRVRTFEWLRRHDIPAARMFMRQDGLLGNDHVCKLEMVQTIRASGHRIDFAVDDRPENVTMFREQGIVCYACGPVADAARAA